MVTAIRLDRVKDRAALPKDGRIVYVPVRHRRGLSIGYRSTSGQWFARVFAHGKLHYPDPLGPEAELSYTDALDKAEAEYRRLRGDAPIGYDVLAAIEDYARTKTANIAAPEAARVWDDLRGLTKHITGALLARQLDELTRPDELERWRDSLSVKPATRRRIYNVLAAVLSNAHRLHGAGDPAAWRRVKRIEIPKTRRARLFIPTDAELAALLEKCEPDFAALVRAAALTACRYGELTALEVRDFDAERGVLALRVSKTGERDVLLSSAAAAFFKDQVDGKTPRARIFTTVTGEPWQASMQHRRMRAATKIRAFVFYSLRHYALSKQLAAGIPSALVAKNAGTSEAMLRAHYHKLVPADRSIFDRVRIAA
jgi:integrase